MAASGEFQRIELLRRVFSDVGSGAAVKLGIGDDAAVLRASSGLVVSVDACVAGVHFLPEWLSWRDVGFKATQAALSDLAAMGARPLSLVASLILPRTFTDRQFLALAEGQALAAGQARCPIVGGNLARGSEVSITTTVLGTQARPVLRRGARPGEELWLVGEVGLAGLGLQVARRRPGRGAGPAAQLKNAALAAFRRPTALLSQGQKLVGKASSMLDISDGLAQDAVHLAEASRVRLVVEEAWLRATFRPGFEELSRRLGGDGLAFALAGGEDYALLATGPKARRPRFCRVIGRVMRGRGAWLRGPDGSVTPLAARGFDHFSG